MKNGFMAKGLAGLGQGLAIAGQMGYQSKLQGDLESQRAELMSKRDEVLQRYENERTDKDIGARAAEGAANRATQKEGFIAQKQSHLEGIQMQLDAKDTKPILVPKGSTVVGLDGKVLYENTSLEDETVTVPEGAAVVSKKSGKELYKNPKEPGSDGLPKIDKDLDDRVNQASKGLAELLGGNYDAFGKLTLPDGVESDVAWGWDRIGELVRNGRMTPEAAKKQVFDEILQKRGKKGDGKSKHGEVLDRLGVPAR